MLTVVVAAHADDGSPTACMDALESQLDDAAEVVLVGDGTWADKWPWARTVPRSGFRVPELWTAGIAHARGRLVALLAGTVVPEADWVALTLRAHDDGTAAVGGPIEPGPDFRLVDWAVFFCRYSPYLLPLPAGALEVPGDNASYRMDVLVSYEAAYADGFWEPFVHDMMRADGHEVVVRPQRIVRPRAGANARTFRRQRYAHGRAHGRLRSLGQSRRALIVGMLATPAVPAVMTARVFKLVFARRRLRARLLVASPIVVWFYAWWAAGELLGRLDTARAGT